MTQAYYRKTPQQALEAQNASAEGLSAQEARRRAEQYGPNKLSEGKKKSTLQVFLEQFKDLMVLILIIAAVISAFSGNVESTIVIFAVLVLNAILGTVQYEKAEKSLESLKAMASPTAKVMRGGVRVEIPSADVVPGDIVLLEAGEEDLAIIHSPVGMPGRALNTPLVQALAEGKRFPPKHCARCLKTCDPAAVPYCITHALIEAVKGNVEEGLFFCGENVGRLDRMRTVRELMDELVTEWRQNQ